MGNSEHFPGVHVKHDELKSVKIIVCDYKPQTFFPCGPSTPMSPCGPAIPCEENVQWLWSLGRVMTFYIINQYIHTYLQTPGPLNADRTLRTLWDGTVDNIWIIWIMFIMIVKSEQNDIWRFTHPVSFDSWSTTFSSFTLQIHKTKTSSGFILYECAG